MHFYSNSFCNALEEYFSRIFPLETQQNNIVQQSMFAFDDMSLETSFCTKNFNHNVRGNKMENETSVQDTKFSNTIQSVNTSS